MGLVDYHDIDCTALEMRSPSKQWWCSYINSRVVGSPLMTWVMFAQAFLDKFVLCSLTEKRRNQFENFTQEHIFANEYEI